MTAFNNVGLHTTISSDGFVVDISKPVVGVVYNTEKYRNYAVQSLVDSFNVSWHGFTDHDSAIKSYHVALIEDTPNETVIVDFSDVQLQTSTVLNGLNLEHGKRYLAAVKAEDAAGHISSVVYSDSKLVDTTGPTPYKCRDRTILYKTSASNSSDTESLSFYAGFDVKKIYIITGSLVSTAQHLQMKLIVGHQVGNFLSLEKAHDRILNFHFSFFSNLKGTLRVKLELNTNLWDSLNFAFSECDVLLAATDDTEVTVRQLSSTLFKASIHVMDPESGIKRVGMLRDNM